MPDTFSFRSRTERGRVTVHNCPRYYEAAMTVDGEVVGYGRDGPVGLPDDHIEEVHAGPAGIAYQCALDRVWRYQPHGRAEWFKLPNGIRGVRVGRLITWYRTRDIIQTMDSAGRVDDAEKPNNNTVDWSTGLTVVQDYSGREIMVVFPDGTERRFRVGRYVTAVLQVKDGVIMGHDDASLSFWRTNSTAASAKVTWAFNEPTNQGWLHQDVTGIHLTGMSLRVLTDKTFVVWPAHVVPMLLDGRVDIALDFLTESGFEVHARWVRR